MKLIFSILDDHRLLPQFLRHYRSAGVTRFLPVVYRIDLVPVVQALVPDAILNVVADESFNGTRDAAHHDAVRRSAVAPEEWYAIADLDEFAEVRGSTLPDACRSAAAAAADHIAGDLVDRVTADGSVPVALGEDLEQQFSHAALVTKRLTKGCAIKVVAARGNVPVRPGHHRAAGRPWKTRALVHHFKWWGDLQGRYAARHASYLRQRYQYSPESARLVEHLTHSGGRLDLADPAMCHAPWRIHLGLERPPSPTEPEASAGQPAAGGSSERGGPPCNRCTTRDKTSLDDNASSAVDEFRASENLPR